MQPANSQSEETNLGGRPTKLTPERQATIIAALEMGHFIQDAAILAGVTKRSVFAWLARAREEEEKGLDTEYTRFLHAVESADVKPKNTAVGTINREMATNYKAAAWFLQHRYPKQWGTVEKRELMGKDGGPIQQEVTHNASDDMRAFLNDDKLRRAIIRLEGEFAGAGQDDAARTRGADLGKPLEGTGSPPTDSRPSS